MHFIEKPFSMSDLAIKVRQVLERKPTDETAPWGQLAHGGVRH